MATVFISAGVLGCAARVEGSGIESLSNFRLYRNRGGPEVRG
jgi:hypothetical protein